MCAAAYAWHRTWGPYHLGTGLRSVPKHSSPRPAQALLEEQVPRPGRPGAWLSKLREKAEWVKPAGQGSTAPSANAAASGAEPDAEGAAEAESAADGGAGAEVEAAAEAAFAAADAAVAAIAVAEAAEAVVAAAEVAGGEAVASGGAAAAVAAAPAAEAAHAAPAEYAAAAGLEDERSDADPAATAAAEQLRAAAEEYAAVKRAHTFTVDVARLPPPLAVNAGGDGRVAFAERVAALLEALQPEAEAAGWGADHVEQAVADAVMQHHLPRFVRAAGGSLDPSEVCR